VLYILLFAIFCTHCLLFYLLHFFSSQLTLNLLLLIRHAAYQHTLFLSTITLLLHQQSFRRYRKVMTAYGTWGLKFCVKN